MRLTIERLRTLILAAGILLIAALIAFLVLAHFKNRFNAREIPRRLGIDIKQEANGVTYTQSSHGKTLFKIHASKVVQLRSGGRALLHDVQIEIYGPDGKSLDRITGNEFEYDQKAGTATAAGPVEITLTRPSAPTALDLGKKNADKEIASALHNMAHAAGSGQIDVKTSGLTFDQKTGVASTAQRVEFTTVQGSGSAVGATFDSQNGQLLLSHAVALNVNRGAESVQLHAQGAAFDRTQMLCTLHGAEAGYKQGTATAGEAQILFRPDGSAVRLDARNVFLLTTANGSRVSSPMGWLEFNQKNQPQHGQMLDGVTMESRSGDRETRGTAPTADLTFAANGDLRRAHLERGVTMHSEQDSAKGARLVRDWRSPVADVDFRRSGPSGQVALSTVNGSGGVVITSATQRGSATESPSRMSADSLTAQFGGRQELSRIVAAGHASLEQTTAAGAQQTTGGDRLDAQFAHNGRGGTPAATSASAQIQSAVVDGHVILTDQPASKVGQAAQAQLSATAAHAVYDGATQRVQLTGEPRVTDGGLQLTADRIDFSQASGDALARGSVKATWQGGANAGTRGGITLGGQGPAHVVAQEALLSRAAGEATFRGQARLWQQANSIAAPVLVLNQSRETLTATSVGKQRVNLTLLNANTAEHKGKPEVVRIQAADLKYSEAERKAVLRGGVVAETAGATVSSSRADIVFLPPGNHAASDGGAAQVDSITATGGVQLSSQGRTGSGEKLVYTGESGNYVLTGIADHPPTLNDPVRGTIRGTALIFNGRNDSVSIEGAGQKTTTQTVAPR